MAETSGHPLYEQCDQCLVIVTAVIRSPDIVIDFFTVTFCLIIIFDSDIYMHQCVCNDDLCACVHVSCTLKQKCQALCTRRMHNMKRGGSDYNMGGSCTSYNRWGVGQKLVELQASYLAELSHFKTQPPSVSY